MYSYKGLYELLKQRGIKKSELTNIVGISSRTIAKIGKGEKIADNVLAKLCEYFNCKTSDLVNEVSSNAVLQTLKEEKKVKLSGGLYHETQVRLTYNSNHIEGSRLTEDQTRLIFETKTIGITEEGIPVDHIIETTNHFRAIDYIIDHAEQTLDENIIKEIHKILKTGTTDSTFDWFNVGEYKALPNTVGGKETTKPAEVPTAIKNLLEWYNSKQVDFETIVEFHYLFESIHPFQDGNGRVGRLIAFKECLKHDIVPFIIEDGKKFFYERGLREWKSERGFLIGTCLDGQDTYKALLDYFEINYKKEN